MNIALINGVNLNFLGIREPQIYGQQNLETLEKDLTAYAAEKSVTLHCFSSNIEGEIVNYLQDCYYKKMDGIIFNPGAFTHYSYALADAIKSISIPVVEVHISNIHAREEFRSHSVTAKSCLGIVGGFGFDGYYMALDGLFRRLSAKNR